MFRKANPRHLSVRIAERTPHRRLTKPAHLGTAAGLMAVLAGIANAHLPSYEGERMRHDNHFIDEGFAEPVRGNCDVTANGPTDPALGSANIYLGGENRPPNFFCLFSSQDDWSFERPIDIIEQTRTPAPDPRELGQELEEGYIPCSPTNPNPFQCPREIRNPQDGSVIQLPGQCIDTGQPDGMDMPDGAYHCALLPGAPRPRTSSVLFSTLTGPDDVDWAVYRYDPVYEEQPIVGAPQVPACTETLESFVTFAYTGPLDMRDARSGERVFIPVEEAGDLPGDVVNNVPDGYGIRVTRPHNTEPSEFNPRPAYASGYAQNGWLLAMDSVVKCIDSFEECLADETGELSKHYRGNDIFFIDEDEAVELYLAWWWDDGKPGKRRGHSNERNKHARKLTDASITTGVIDQFLVGDFIQTGITGPLSANGRYVHGGCADPRKTGKVDMVIETN
jgi:hypothetical protein